MRPTRDETISHKYKTMPASNSENIGSNKTEDEELTRDQGEETVGPEESSLLAVDHHTTSDHNHQAQQQQGQPEADVAAGQTNSAENGQQVPTGGQLQVLTTRRQPSPAQDGVRQPSQEITMNGHAAMPDPHAETNHANPVLLAGIADASAASHVNDHGAPPAPDALNEVDVIRELERVEGEIAIHEEELAILNRLRELRRRRGAGDYSGFHKRGFDG